MVKRPKKIQQGKCTALNNQTSTVKQQCMNLYMPTADKWFSLPHSNNFFQTTMNAPLAEMKKEHQPTRTFKTGNVFKMGRSNSSIKTNPFIDLEVATSKSYNAKLKQSGKTLLLQ